MDITKVLIINVKILALLVVALLVKSAYDRHGCESLEAQMYKKRQVTLALLMDDCGSPCVEQAVLLQRQLKIIDNAGLTQEGCAK